MFTFGEWQCGITEAALILKCTKRTLQNYYHPEKRDPVKWHYLELHATRRVLPEGLWFDDGALHTHTGYSYPAHELEQWAFFQSTKNGMIEDLERENAQLRAQIEVLQKPAAPQRTADVIPFPTRTKGDVTA